MEDTTTKRAPTDIVAGAQAELQAAMERDDAVRLKILDDLYRSLEGELEGDQVSRVIGSSAPRAALGAEGKARGVARTGEYERDE